MAANRLLAWFAVPDGYELKIKVSGSDNSFHVTGNEVTQPGGARTVPHSELVAGTNLKIQQGEAYSTSLLIAFQGATATTVTVEATVTSPDGKPYGKPRPAHVSSGTNGDTDSALVIAIARK